MKKQKKQEKFFKGMTEYIETIHRNNKGVGGCEKVFDISRRPRRLTYITENSLNEFKKGENI